MSKFIALRDQLAEERSVFDKPNADMPKLYWSRYLPTQLTYEQDVIFLLGLIIAAMVATAGSQLLRSLSDIVWIPILMDLVLYIPARFSFEPNLKGTFLKRIAPSLTNPCTFVWFFAFFLPAIIWHQLGPYVWVAYFMAITTWRLSVLATAIAEHYIAYAVENHRVDEQARDKWRRVIAKHTFFASPRAPLFPHPLLPDSLRLSEMMFSYSKRTLFMAIATLIATVSLAFAPRLFYASPVHFACLFVCAPCVVATGLSIVHLQKLSALLKPLLVFLHSPMVTDFEVPDDWAIESPRGSTHDRRTFFFVNVLLGLLCLAHPLCMFITGDKSDAFAIHAFMDPVTESFYDVSDVSIVFWVSIVGIPPCLVVGTLFGLYGASAGGANQLFEDDEALLHYHTEGFQLAVQEHQQ